MIKYIFNEYDRQYVIYFVAESYEDNGIKNTDLFIKINVNGTFTLVDIAKSMDG